MSYILFFFFHTRSLESSVWFGLQFKSDPKFSLEILDLCLDFSKSTVEKVNAHMQAVPNTLKRFLTKIKYVLKLKWDTLGILFLCCTSCFWGSFAPSSYGRPYCILSQVRAWDSEHHTGMSGGHKV